MKLSKQIIAKIESKGATVSDDGDYYTIYIDNSCGEDFQFTIEKGEDEIEDIISYCDDFDSGEHFKLWYGANRGESQDARTLLDNCEEIKGVLEEISLLLTYLDY